MRAAIERYTVDRGSLTRSYPVPMSQARRDRFRKFYEEWLASLKPLDFDSMSQDGKIDYLLFKNHLEYELRQLDIQRQQLAEIEPLIPFADTIIDLEEARRRMEPIDSAKIAATLDRFTQAGGRAAARRSEARCCGRKKTVANRAVAAINGLRGTTCGTGTRSTTVTIRCLPGGTKSLISSLDQSLTSYATFITEKVVGIRLVAGQPQGEPPRGQGSQPDQRAATQMPAQALHDPAIPATSSAIRSDAKR